jgi:hypothetical protein
MLVSDSACVCCSCLNVFLVTRPFAVVIVPLRAWVSSAFRRPECQSFEAETRFIRQSKCRKRCGCTALLSHPLNFWFSAEFCSTTFVTVVMEKRSAAFVDLETLPGVCTGAGTGGAGTGAFADVLFRFSDFCIMFLTHLAATAPFLLW